MGAPESSGCKFSPLLHAIGFPALGQHHAAHHRPPPQGHVIIGQVPVEVATKATHFVLQPLTDADFYDVETIVVYLDVRAGVDHQEPLAAVDFGCQPGYKRNIHLCAIHLSKEKEKVYDPQSRGWQTFTVKGQSKYFRLCGPYDLCQLCPRGRKAARDNSN